jgi:hypothetical protein
MWISGGEIRRATGSYGCTWITRMFPIHSSLERYDRVTVRSRSQPNFPVQPLMESWWGLKQPSVSD